MKNKATILNKINTFKNNVIDGKKENSFYFPTKPGHLVDNVILKT